jgi:AbrB family transcriptional regulator, transcriptional pleiotropic regulator of transition state genes
MKSTGVVRRIDHLGRIVIPMELRRTLGLVEKDGLEIFINGNQIVLRKYEPGCVLCGAMDNVKPHKSGKLVCAECLK